MPACPPTGVGIQPNCCGGDPYKPCARCLGGKSHLYWEIVFSGIFDEVPGNCNSCPRYNDAPFTLSTPPPLECLPFSAEGGIYDETPCCWRCTINAQQMDCIFPPGAPNNLDLIIAKTGSDYYINVLLGDIYFRKHYSSLPDCRTLIAEDIPWISNGGGRCAGDALSTCTITARNSVVYPCCRDICHPDETPGPITIVVAGLSGGDCDCAGLNGTYVLTRRQRSVLGCWNARFPETCGMNAILITFGVFGEVRFYNADTYPFGTILSFNLMHYSPFSSYFPTPHANCNQFNGIEYRTFGDGLCSVPGTPGYATAIPTW